MLKPLRAIALVAMALAGPANAQAGVEHRGNIAQFYSYHLKDRARFENGYREHLEWHARHQDPLVWYAWTVESGPRRGQLIDGTAGTSFAALDARPDLKGDGADFARNAAPYVDPENVETWALWAAPSSATPLEHVTPSAVMDVFLLQVAPGEVPMFERAVVAMTRRHAASGIRLSWYRKLRGGAAPAYMILLSRERWADIDQSGGLFETTLERTYQAEPDAVRAVLARTASLSVETWTYEPRLSLIPGTPLAP